MRETPLERCVAVQTTVPEPGQLPPAESGAGRVVVIDILRGLAIFWVMTFHLWTDMTGGVLGVSPLYERLGERIRDGNPLAALTALGELVLGSGYQGVAVFMMLSGLSLTMNAYRRGQPSARRTFASRFRKVIVPYWGGIVFAVGLFALVALLQSWRDGGSRPGAPAIVGAARTMHQRMPIASSPRFRAARTAGISSEWMSSLAISGTRSASAFV